MTRYQCPKCQQQAAVGVPVLSVVCVRCGVIMQPVTPQHKAPPQATLIKSREPDVTTEPEPDDELVPF